ncbi:MAG: hypothetical protein HUU20_00695 [Pirellulales bacterium]|nr:hypothetical protein [Pirellulales bacterium]
MPSGPHIADAKNRHSITGYPGIVDRPASNERHDVVVSESFVPCAIGVVYRVRHRDLQIGLGAALDPYAGLQTEKIGNPQSLDLGCPNLDAATVAFQFDDAESTLPQDGGNLSRANRTDADVS